MCVCPTAYCTDIHISQVEQLDFTHIYNIYIYSRLSVIRTLMGEKSGSNSRKFE